MEVRLIQALKECNISLETAVKFLHSKGFDVAKENALSKISECEYHLLLEEYQADASIKRDAENFQKVHRKYLIAKKRGSKSLKDCEEKYMEWVGQHKKPTKNKSKKKKKKIAKGKSSYSTYNKNGYKFGWIKILSTPM